MSETEMAALFRHFDSKIDALVREYEQKLDEKVREEEKIFNLMTTRLETVTSTLIHVEKKIAEYEPSFKNMADSMPKGDFAGHARYHENVMKTLEDKAAFWKKMRESVATWGAIGALGLILTAVWKFLLQGPHV